jgi:hypothetical protein
MAKPFKGVGSFVVVIVLVYVAVKYWAQIKAALAPALNTVTKATTPGSSTATLPVMNMSPGRPGDPAYSAAFGGGYVGPPGGFNFGSLGGGGGFGGNVGPGQTDESASGSPFVYINTSGSFGLGCSTHLWDRKPLCP